MDRAQDIFLPRARSASGAHTPRATGDLARPVLTALARAPPPVRDPTVPRASPSSASPY